MYFRRLKMYYKITLLLLLWMKSINSQMVCNNSTLLAMDTNVAKVMTIGQTARRFPENLEQTKAFCDETYRTIIEIEKYKNKCMQNLPKQVTSVILYTIKSMINGLCKKDSKRLRRLLAAAPCGNKGSNEFNKCHMIYVDKLLGAKHAEEKQRIPHVCCEYYKLFDCISERGNNFKECDGRETMKTIHDFIRQIFQGSVDLICSDWTEGSDKCDRLPSPPSKRKGQKRTRSFIVPLIDVLDSIPQVF